MREETGLPENELELYVHIPFCIRKCYYCDFLSMPADVNVRRHYVARLIREIEEKASVCSGSQVSTVFFGGGTPSVLQGVQILEIMAALRQNFRILQDAEITLECNPGTLTKAKLEYYKEAGINRLSLGLQSAKFLELQRLGRIHSYEDFLCSFDLARKAGFDNINVDLMSALPGQTLRDWEYTLKKTLDLKPEHISAYSLIIEEGTPFYQWYGKDELCRQQGQTPRFLPPEETERMMYETTRELLAKKGYCRYEISNYALPGRECRHNIGYWRLTPYLGFGLGSSSLMRRIRFSNTRKLKEYCAGRGCGLPEALWTARDGGKERRAHRHWEPEDSSLLGKKQQMEEFMFLGLRMTEGISRRRFRELFGVELEAVYGDVTARLQQAGRVRLTEQGISVSNYALSRFLLDS